jgi:hypothetical protein
MKTKFVGFLVIYFLNLLSVKAQTNDSSVNRFTFSYSFLHYLEPPNRLPFNSVSGIVLGGLRIGYEFSLSNNPYSVDLGLNGASNTPFEFATPDVAKRAISVYLSANKIFELNRSISAYTGIRISYNHYWADFYQYDPNASTGEQRKASQKLVGSESQTAEQLGPNIRAKFQFGFLPVNMELGYAPTILAFADQTLRFQYIHMIEALITF